MYPTELTVAAADCYRRNTTKTQDRWHAAVDTPAAVARVVAAGSGAVVGTAAAAGSTLCRLLKLSLRRRSDDSGVGATEKPGVWPCDQSCCLGGDTRGGKRTL